MYVDRIAAYDKTGPTINAIITLNAKALEAADRLDAALKASGFVGPLHGIPVVVKDQANVAGMPTTLGSVLFKHYYPDRDCFVVEHVRRAGAIILGKTTLGELGGGDTHGSLFGSTRNPYDLERTVGGSSGGSAACVAAKVFDQAVVELHAAGAEIVDPIVIPHLQELLAKCAGSFTDEEASFHRYFGRSAHPPFTSRAAAAASPDFAQVARRSQERWKRSPDPNAHCEYLKARDELMTGMLKVMADHRLDAIVHKAVEHQPTLIKDGVNPPFVDQKGAPHLNTFLVFVPSIVVPAGFTRDNLPAGITFLGRPYDDGKMIKLAYAYEQATHHRRPPASTTPL